MVCPSHVIFSTKFGGRGTAAAAESSAGRLAGLAATAGASAAAAAAGADASAILKRRRSPYCWCPRDARGLLCLTVWRAPVS